MKTNLKREEILYYTKVYNDLYNKFKNNSFTFYQGEELLHTTQSIERSKLAVDINRTNKFFLGLFSAILENLVEIGWAKKIHHNQMYLIPFDEIVSNIDILTTLI